MLDTIASVLGGIAVGPLTGSTPPIHRQNMVDEFTARRGPAVLVSQIQAGGVGLNIQAASVVILTEPQWKPTIEDQAIARCHRMGQVRSVDVHRLLAEDTVDQRMLEILATKAVLFDEYVRRSELKDQSPDAVDVSDLKAAEEVGTQVEAERRIIEMERKRLRMGVCLSGQLSRVKNPFERSTSTCSAARTGAAPTADEHACGSGVRPALCGQPGRLSYGLRQRPGRPGRPTVTADSFQRTADIGRSNDPGQLVIGEHQGPAVRTRVEPRQQVGDRLVRGSPGHLSQRASNLTQRGPVAFVRGNLVDPAHGHQAHRLPVVHHREGRVPQPRQQVVQEMGDRGHAGKVTGSAVMISRTGTVRNRDCTTVCWFSAVAALVRNQPRIMNHSPL